MELPRFHLQSPLWDYGVDAVTMTLNKESRELLSHLESTCQGLRNVTIISPSVWEMETSWLEASELWGLISFHDVFDHYDSVFKSFPALKKRIVEVYCDEAMQWYDQGDRSRDIRSTMRSFGWDIVQVVPQFYCDEEDFELDSPRYFGCGNPAYDYPNLAKFVDLMDHESREELNQDAAEENHSDSEEHHESGSDDTNV